MAKKSLILSNDDARVTFSNTASFYFQDSDSSVTGSEISSSVLNFPSIAANRLIYVSGSGYAITPVVTGTVNKGALVWNATTNAWSASADIVEYYSGSSGGALSGNFNDPGSVKLIDISGVSSGILPVAYGGTGINAPVGSNIMLVAKSGSYTYLSASAASSGSIVTATSNGWVLTKPAYSPDVRFYTSGSTGNTFTWTKPDGARFARVILQGAGGGGSGGTATVYGAGGGSGGFTDLFIDVSSISTMNVTGGLGGAGGATNAVGSSGGTTYVSSYSANGGGGGLTPGAGNNGGAAGTGTTKNGGKGAAGTGTAADTVYGMPSGGGSLLAAGTIVTMILNGNKNFGYTTTTDGIDISTSLIVASGSAGGASPSRPGYGAGGGGGSPNNPGGPGGHGYALIISW